MNEEDRVLSIQSWVSHGYVGNKCAVFALQCLGIDVDPINTVQFSNNTGYPSFKGQILSGEDVWSIFEGLVQNDLAHYSHLLTGYNASVSSLRIISKIRSTLKQINPNLIHVCDPVMGDEGVFYVPRELIDVYRQEIIPQADILLPNQFEAETLTDTKISSEADAIAATIKLHDMGVNIVIITSLYYSTTNEIILLASSRKTDSSGFDRFTIAVPRLEGYYTGTGDLLAALLLGWISKDKGDLRTAVEKSVSTLWQVLNKTSSIRQTERGGKPPDASEGKAVLAPYKEIRLVQSRAEVVSPSILFPSRPVL